MEVVECTTAEAAELVISTAGPELLLTVVVLSGKAAPELPDNTVFFAKPYQPKDLLAAILN